MYLLPVIDRVEVRLQMACDMFESKDIKRFIEEEMLFLKQLIATVEKIKNA